jgi:homoserine dehydrogenase
VKRVRIVQVGVGLIGGTVLEQALDHRAEWRERLGIDFRVGALVGSAGALVDVSSEPNEGELRTILQRRRSGASLEAIARELGRSLVPAEEALMDGEDALTVVVDTAAGGGTAPLLGAALKRGAAVVVANKAPFALPTGDPNGDALWAGTGSTGRVRYEATCGAGLPVISTLQTLLMTGDRVTEITGTVSGTFGAIFSDVARGLPFSTAVREAKAAGYTEPDPRDDLSGLDVARKALILARTMGRSVDLNEIAVESLVPEALRDCTVEAFLERIAEADGPIADRAHAARSEGKTLKYVATVPAEGPIRVGLEAIETSRVLGALQGPENIVSITTRRYNPYPLAVTGPGAGAAVTAAGVIGDILAVATHHARES